MTAYMKKTSTNFAEDHSPCAFIPECGRTNPASTTCSTADFQLALL